MASHIGHYDFLSYCALVENEAIGRVKYTMLEVTYDMTFAATIVPYNPFLLQKMLQPCGPPPERDED
jgi:splicing factor 3B subunit 5